MLNNTENVENKEVEVSLESENQEKVLSKEEKIYWSKLNDIKKENKDLKSKLDNFLKETQEQEKAKLKEKEDFKNLSEKLEKEKNELLAQYEQEKKHRETDRFVFDVKSKANELQAIDANDILNFIKQEEGLDIEKSLKDLQKAKPYLFKQEVTKPDAQANYAQKVLVKKEENNFKVGGGNILQDIASLLAQK